MAAPSLPSPASANPRRAGILLHVTSLPSRFGIGDLGPAAETFLRWMAEAGQRVWQVLPLGPTGFGDSPYGGHSSAAGNPLLISPELLAAEGWLRSEELTEAETSPPPSEATHVSFATVRTRKETLLRRAFAVFRQAASTAQREELMAFAFEPGVASWLDDWCLYAALKARHGGGSWQQWAPELRERRPPALASATIELGEEIAFHRFCQWNFRRQWRRLRLLAGELGVEILGDLPMYPALDSADVWLAPHLFELDEQGSPLAVAGVPPDYFSETGQLWGNPVYRWERHHLERFQWWCQRVGGCLELVDRLRLDHFRGFEAYWRIPMGAKTAAEGSWRPGPGEALFSALREALGSRLPLVAEDLGVITPEVEALLRAVDLPRMRVLQFAFDELDSAHLPHRYDTRMVAYTATHDNDTTRSWFADLPREQRERTLEYLGVKSGRELVEAMVRTVYQSVANTAVVPMQDLLELGGEGRMNAPGTGQGNWSWRVRSSELTPERAHRLRRLALISGRLAPPAE